MLVTALYQYDPSSRYVCSTALYTFIFELTTLFIVVLHGSFSPLVSVAVVWN